ncbi:limonene-1,2-epoxide hydrolase family protein [uncultured Phenylobacterium sp.]|uniref:limonene-1,2-epoxide hydrolase family protein n=1 Tax=uncultured Phenylobacterium sp. TaxID=349273 RepID=UPI0025E7E125|nr:limonene-1,2-epoxide hydrolase family protein [uncultured Phenylobacterium sp.]
MTPAKPLDVVAAFLNAMEAMDFEAGCRLVAPDCEYTNLPMGTARGPEGVRATLEPFFAPTLSNQFLVTRQVADGDTVVMERLDRHQLGPERWAELPVIGIFEVKDGLITVWREYFDLGTLLGQWPELQQAMASPQT